MQLFYAENLINTSKTYTFNKEESKHIVRVLRKKQGDEIYITNGMGDLFTCLILIATDRKCEVEIKTHQFFERKKYYIHLAVAPTKMNDRYEWFLEKATEIGVDEITPIICEHSERKQVKIERYQKIILAAMKQSNQYYLPKLNEPISCKKFIDLPFDGEKFIAHCEEQEKHTLKEHFSKQTQYIMMIGPEGDFSPKEIMQAKEQNFKPVTLGNTRLRTETAAVVACHSFVFGNEIASK